MLPLPLLLYLGAAQVDAKRLSWCREHKQDERCSHWQIHSARSRARWRLKGQRRSHSRQHFVFVLDTLVQLNCPQTRKSACNHERPHTTYRCAHHSDPPENVNVKGKGFGLTSVSSILRSSTSCASSSLGKGEKTGLGVPALGLEVTVPTITSSKSAQLKSLSGVKRQEQPRAPGAKQIPSSTSTESTPCSLKPRFAMFSRSSPPPPPIFQGGKKKEKKQLRSSSPAPPHSTHYITFFGPSHPELHHSPLSLSGRQPPPLHSTQPSHSQRRLWKNDNLSAKGPASLLMVKQPPPFSSPLPRQLWSLAAQPGRDFFLSAAYTLASCQFVVRAKRVVRFVQYGGLLKGAAIMSTTIIIATSAQLGALGRTTGKELWSVVVVVQGTSNNASLV